MAEEGGSGHYLPGSMSSFVDGVPLTESVIFRLNVLNYNGEASKSVTIPVARTVTAGLKAGVNSYRIVGCMASLVGRERRLELRDVGNHSLRLDRRQRRRSPVDDPSVGLALRLGDIV